MEEGWREMQEAEKKRLHEMFEMHVEAFRKTYQDMCKNPFDDSERSVVDQQGLSTVVSKIGKQANQILLLHQAGELRGRNLEHCIEKFYDLLRGFFLVVHQAMSIAGPTLARIICGLMTKRMDSVIELLECTIDHGNHGFPGDGSKIPTLVEKVMGVSKSLVDCPKTDSNVIMSALLLIEDDIKKAFLEVTAKKAQHLRGKSHVEDSTGKYDATEDTKKHLRIITDMTISVVSVTAPVIRELANVVRKWRDTSYISHVGVLAEDLLMVSVTMRHHIFMIKGFIIPLQYVRLSAALEGLNINACHISKKLQPHCRGSAESFLRLSVLRKFIDTAKDQPVKIAPSPGRSWSR